MRVGTGERCRVEVAAGVGAVVGVVGVEALVVVDAVGWVMAGPEVGWARRKMDGRPHRRMTGVVRTGCQVCRPWNGERDSGISLGLACSIRCVVNRNECPKIVREN